MSIYRKNAKKDMIVELTEEELKLACIRLVWDEKNISSKNESVEDVELIAEKEIDGEGRFKGWLFRARIECEEIE